MFYSQFILAKKGPLGTIWIAAHLERKLRKNQVADTDIGVSVDSILFPEVPIALRLSSHLLLGVVRIYSRKVNYLFDDCSEALLKIKQAFRSTAVDLPPEESTAPYHSITLPETFDLDDFELPDNDVFQGNYVDHHISTREQITLQDTMEGVVYSTSQFGLDERFGDGDTLQAGLDLEEDLFLDKGAAPGHGEVSEVDPQASAMLMALPKGDGVHDGMPGSSEAVLVNVTRNEIEVIANSQFIDYAQAPSTPGLIEEPNSSSVKDGLASDEHLESEDHSLMEIVGTGNTSTNSDLHQKDSAMNLSLADHLSSDTIACMPVEENGCIYHDSEGSQAKPQGDLPSSAVTIIDGASHAQDGSNGLEINNEVFLKSEPSKPSTNQVNGECEEAIGARSNETVNVEFTNNMVELPSNNKDVASSPIHPLELAVDSEHVNVEAQACDSIQSEGNQLLKPTLHEEIQEDGRNPDEQLNNVTSIDNQSEYAISAVTSDLPAPEKLLSVPQMHLDKPDDLLVELTPDRDILEGGDVSGAETKISGKKRSFTESSLTIQSLNSFESSGVTRSKRTTDSIPDDDDLLSSILVGRRSLGLKMKPTPPAPEAVSTKRARSASRPSTLKRKVLMDDFMVLHGDTIRQQLTNTEDIRRLRKKAPCTSTEILIIQRQFLEEGIFNEPVLTGMPAELACLHGEALDLSGIMISENDDNNASLEVANDRECSARPIVCQDSEIEGNAEPRNNVGEVADCRTSEHELLVEATGVSDAVNHSVTSQMEPISGDGHGIPACSGGESAPLDKAANADASLLLPSDKLYTQPDQEFLANDKNSCEGLDSVVLDHNTDNGAAIGTELKAVEEVSLEGSKVDASDEIRDDVEVDRSVPTGNADASLVNHSSEADGCINITCLNIDQASENIENDKLGVGSEGSDGARTSECEEKDKKSYHSCNEESKVDSTCSVGVLHGDFKSASLDDGNHLGFADPGQQSTMDIDITSLDRHAVGDSGGFEDATFADDTGFLNVDDDEVGEEDDDGMPGAEDASLLENSGWSSRTRAVAKYLQTLFDKESGHGRKALPMNNLLAGKTRKEASRMFFETLVLKTKDYVQVEQAKPFDNINIMPRAKLMKSEF